MSTRTAPGPRLRAARKAAGLTQVQLAERIGVVPSFISSLEVGYRTPSLEWLHRVAEVLGCDPADLDERLAPRR